MIVPLLALLAPPTRPTSLLELPQRYAQGYVRIAEKGLQIGNVAAASGLYAEGGAKSGFSAVSYAVPRGARYFRAVLGLKDGKTVGATNRVRLLLDGKPVYERDLKSSEPAKRINVTLNGAKVLTFRLDPGTAVGDAFFTADSTPDPKPAELRPLLTAPENGVHITDDRVLLSWQPVAGATSYSVEIIVTKLQTPDAQIQKAYLYNVLGGGTSFRLDLTRFPTGSLRWSVIAFNDEGRLGKFSEDRLLVRE